MTAENFFLVEAHRFDLPESLFAADSTRYGFTVQSTPRPYSVEVAPDDVATFAYLDRRLEMASRPLLVIDERVAELHFPLHRHPERVPRLEIDATEEAKSLDGSLKVMDFLLDNKMTRDAMVFVVGGGIVQDTAGLACGMYKRGIPWTFVPTTLLAQSDSCIGSKTGVNHRHTKNLIGMFSAPRSVLVHPGYISTLDDQALLSGLGEIFKLCVTGGDRCLDVFEQSLDRALQREADSISRLVAISLGVKRAVIEVDEFETNLRRSLNFGHSIGHAFEAVTDYSVPHGIAVSVGVLVECELSLALGRLDRELINRLIPSVRRLIPESVGSLLAQIEIEEVVDALGRDKKVEQSILKLAAPTSLGHLEFLNFQLDGSSVSLLESAIENVIVAL